MKFILFSFIGIAINIWSDIFGAGGDEPGATALQNRSLSFVILRDGTEVFTRV